LQSKDPTPEELHDLDPEMGTVEDWVNEFHWLAQNGFKIVRIEN